jgi:hypothetical protein
METSSDKRLCRAVGRRCGASRWIVWRIKLIHTGGSKHTSTGCSMKIGIRATFIMSAQIEKEETLLGV